jgi:pimeloyl-ACP methyl ester carboxylesterase
MVISTPKTVFVVFRGTDRVAQAKKKVGYDWAEWIQTDFVALGIPPQVGPLRGLVHAGFWGSLTAPASLFVPANSQVPGGISNGLPFREAVLAVIKAFGGGQKRVWVVGHSLGAAHVQLYAAYLTANGLSPQGVYAIAAPHVGDQTFVNQLNGMFPNNRLQRFDFVHDPVTKVPPNAPLPQPDKSSIIYARAGTRVYYDDVQTVQFRTPERSPAEAARIAGLLVGGGALGGIFAAGDFCFHYPQWYLHAAYNQLNQTTVGRIPSPLPTPVMRGNIYSSFCGPIQVTRGNRSAGSAMEGILPGR